MNARQFVFFAMLTAAAVSIASLPAMAAAKKGSDVEAMFIPEELPPVIGRAVTYFGPVFTDKDGMTLYSVAAKPPCNGVRATPPPDTDPLLLVYSKWKTPFCTDQWPPLMASADDKPVGNWTIVQRPEGGKQWAYKGVPLHRSYKDFLPGDVSGPNRLEDLGGYGGGGIGEIAVASVPLALPPGVSASFKKAFGYTAQHATGALYVLDKPSAKTASSRDEGVRLQNVSMSACLDCVKDDRWQPFLASIMASDRGLWTVKTLNDGRKAWAYKGQIVYTYAFDQATSHFKGLGADDRARLVTLEPHPMAPLGITVQNTFMGPLYADARGMTLYMFLCTTIDPDLVGQRLMCDGVGTDPAFPEGYCTAPDRCGERWIPLEAPAETQPQGGMWSVAVIPDKRYPLRWRAAKIGEKLGPDELKVWMFRGRPVYKNVDDKVPGETFGYRHSAGISVDWVPVRAGPVEDRSIAAGG